MTLVFNDLIDTSQKHVGRVLMSSKIQALLERNTGVSHGMGFYRSNFKGLFHTFDQLVTSLQIE